jgi:hypothetical protein
MFVILVKTKLNPLFINNKCFIFWNTLMSYILHIKIFVEFYDFYALHVMGIKSNLMQVYCEQCITSKIL